DVLFSVSLHPPSGWSLAPDTTLFRSLRGGAGMGTVTTRLQLALEDQLVRPYRTVPVDVRAGESLEVTLCYDRRAALVDLGCEGPAGWRGWSGGARNRFAITPHAATPGYVAGRVEPGPWHVVLRS